MCFFVFHFRLSTCLDNKAMILVAINTVSINSFIMKLSQYYKYEQWGPSGLECWLPFS